VPRVPWMCSRLHPSIAQIPQTANKKAGWRCAAPLKLRHLGNNAAVTAPLEARRDLAYGLDGDGIFS
jgi:hypothetical protein